MKKMQINTDGTHVSSLNSETLIYKRWNMSFNVIPIVRDIHATHVAES